MTFKRKYDCKTELPRFQGDAPKYCDDCTCGANPPYPELNSIELNKWRHAAEQRQLTAEERRAYAQAHSKAWRAWRKRQNPDKVYTPRPGLGTPESRRAEIRRRNAAMPKREPHEWKRMYDQAMEQRRAA